MNRRIIIIIISFCVAQSLLFSYYAVIVQPEYFNVINLSTIRAKALNSLAVTDDNKQKIVDAGALPHYVKLLSPERDEAEQQEAAHGVWMLAFKCKDSIVKEPGCLDGHYLLGDSIV